LFSLAYGLYISFFGIIALLSRVVGADDGGGVDGRGVNILTVLSFSPLIISLINL